MYEKKNAVYYFQIAIFVAEIFEFSKICKLPNTDSIHSIKF